MATTYSTNLQLIQIGTGEQAGTWGDTTNYNIGTLIEQAISGYATVSFASGDVILTMDPGTSCNARNIYLELTGATAARTLTVPGTSPNANKKLYFVYNNSGFAITVKVAAQTGVTLPNGAKSILVCNGTDIVPAINYINGITATGNVLSSNTLLGTYPIATSGFVNSGVTFLKNRAAVSTTLSSAISSTALSISLTDGTGFPTGGGTILIDGEQITYASRAGNVLTVSNTSNRGVNSTGPSWHSSGASVSSLTFGSTTLSSGIDNTVTTIPITAGGSFPAAGTILIDSEQISYTGNTGTTLTGATRGANGTTAASHLSTAAVVGVQTVSTLANITYDDVTGTLTVPTLNVSSGLYTNGFYTGCKNRIINGDMNIFQRGTSFTVGTGSGSGSSYTLDRWLVNYSGAMITTITAINYSTIAGEGIVYNLKAGVTQVSGALASTDLYSISQLVEGYNCNDFITRTFTLSFLVRSNLVGTYAVNFRVGGGGFPVSYKYYTQAFTVDSVDTWEKKVITVNNGIPSTGATGSFTSGVGMYVSFILAAGSSMVNSTPNQWTSTSSSFGISGQNNFTSSTSNTFYIANVQLETGAYATNFEQRSIALEQELCERYYQIVPYAFSGPIYNANSYATNIPLRTAMRSTPTATGNQQNEVSGFTATLASTTYTPVNELWVKAAKTATSTANQGRYVESVTLDAELP